MIIGALGLGIYFFKVSFAAFVAALTVALAQLYSQLGEPSNDLLAVRLEETAIGGAVAIGAAIWIFPVATHRAARIAEHAYIGSLADLLARAADDLSEPPSDAPLSSASRALDQAHQQLLVTAQPLGRDPGVAAGSSATSPCTPRPSSRHATWWVISPARTRLTHVWPMISPPRFKTGTTRS